MKHTLLKFYFLVGKKHFLDTIHYFSTIKKTTNEHRRRLKSTFSMIGGSKNDDSMNERIPKIQIQFLILIRSRANKPFID